MIRTTRRALFHKMWAFCNIIYRPALALSVPGLGGNEFFQLRRLFPYDCNVPKHFFSSNYIRNLFFFLTFPNLPSLRFFLLFFTKPFLRKWLLLLTTPILSRWCVGKKFPLKLSNFFRTCAHWWLFPRKCCSIMTAMKLAPVVDFFQFVQELCFQRFLS